MTSSGFLSISIRRFT